MAKEQPFTPAAGNPEICFTRFTGAVDHTPHNRDSEGSGNPLQALLNLFRDPNKIYLASAAGRTGNEINTALSEPKRLENLETDFNLIDRIPGERNAQGIADTVAQQDSQTDS